MEMAALHEIVLPCLSLPESKLAVMRAKDALRDDLARAHLCELETREELARIQKEHGEERI